MSIVKKNNPELTLIFDDKADVADIVMKPIGRPKILNNNQVRKYIDFSLRTYFEYFFLN